MQGADLVPDSIDATNPLRLRATWILCILMHK